MPKRKNPIALDPRQQAFFTHYLDPKSPSFANTLQSAIKAGYTEEYGKHLTSQLPDWYTERLRTDKMIKKAENNLTEFLEMDTKELIYMQNEPLIDEQGNFIKRENPQLQRNKLTATMFVAERLDKKRYSKLELHGDVTKMIKDDDEE